MTTTVRYGQCDETCTVDCGHCKGQGPPKPDLVSIGEAARPCYAVRPGTLGYQQCVMDHGHEGDHRSQDRGTWNGPHDELDSTSQLVPIGEAARLLGVSIGTLRRWEEDGKLVPERTLGGHRRYTRASLDRARGA